MAAEALPRDGRRIVLRRLSVADLEQFQAYRGDAEVGRYQGWSSQSDAEALSFLKSMGAAELLQSGEWCQIGIAERESGMLIGDIGMCVRREENAAELGFTLRAQSQGLGLGAEAVSGAMSLLFENPDIERIICITDARNLPAIRLLERLGLNRIRSEEAIFRSEPCREHVFSCSRDARA